MDVHVSLHCLPSLSRSSVGKHCFFNYGLFLPKPVHTVVCVPVVWCILGGTPTGWAGGRRAHRKAQTLKVLFVGRRKKVSGRRKTQSRSSVKSRSSGTGSKRRQGRVKKRKGKKSKVALEGSVPTARVSSLVQLGGGMHRKSLLVLY